MNTRLDKLISRRLGIWRSSTLDGYWEDRADKDLQYVFLLGQLHATKSIHSSYGNHATRLRIKHLEREIEQLDIQLEGEL